MPAGTGRLPGVAALRRASRSADLVHAHGLRAGLVAAAARRGRPLVLTLHNPVPPGRAAELAARAAVRAADVVLAASPDLAAGRPRAGCAAVRDAPCPRGRRHRPVASGAVVRAELGLGAGRPLVLAVGRLHRQKGYDVLLDAAARWARSAAPPLVAIAGDGPLAADLAARVRDRRLPVALLGHRADVADLLAAADVVVLPSRWEARSLTAQQALRAGRPLVSTRTGGLPSLLGDGAELVAPGDAAALADAVAGLLADRARAGALAAAGRRRAGTWPNAAATAGSAGRRLPRAPRPAREPAVTRRAAAAVLALLAVLAAGVQPASAADGGARADRVLVVGVPGLAWDDVGAATPALSDLARTGGIGALSVRGARARTCLLDGWLTLGAGNRSRAADDPGPAPVDPALSRCGRQERTADTGLTDPSAVVAAATATAGNRSFGAAPGALGRAVGCAGVAGRTAALAVAAPGVPLDGGAVLPADPAGLRGLLDACPLTVVSLDQLTGAGTPGARATATGTDPRLRAAALGQVDTAVARLRAAAAALPGHTLLLLAGVSEVGDGRPGCTSASPWLRVPPPARGSPRRAPAALPTSSSSTWRLPRCARSAGRRPRRWAASRCSRPARTRGRRPRSPSSPPTAPRPRCTTAAPACCSPRCPPSAPPSCWRACSRSVACRAGAGGSPALCGRRCAVGAWPPPRCRPPPTWPACCRGSAPPTRGPPCSARCSPPTCCSPSRRPPGRGGAGRSARPPRRSRSPRQLSATSSPARTWSATGSWGTTPRRRPVHRLGQPHLGRAGGVRAAAGRGRRGRGRRRSARPRRAAGTVALLLGGALVALDAAPELGRDLGGPLGAVPGVLVLAMLLARVRVTAARMAAVLLAAVAVVTGVSVLDWLRPAAVRTHLGRFVQQALDGDAGTVVARKAAANLRIVVGGPLPLLLGVAALAAAWLVRPGGLLRGGAVPAGPAALRAGLTAAALALAIGTAVNDSGVAVPSAAAAVLVPLAVWVAAGERRAAPEAVPAVPSDPAGAGRRVTVGSRGSTVWNA